jgi:hypothetical protein
MRSDFADAITVGRTTDLVEYMRDGQAAAAVPEIPSSDTTRGLALESLLVKDGWEGLRAFLKQKKEIYFLSVAFDLSEAKPVVLPPKEVPAEAVYKVAPGETITFTLGHGAPIFPPREITGGLIVYLIVCEAKGGIRHVGEVLGKVHEDLAKDDSLLKVIKGFVTNPAQSLVTQGLSAFTAALQPIATILKSNGDNYVALFSGIYPAKGPWAKDLSATRNGATLTLRELP